VWDFPGDGRETTYYQKGDRLRVPDFANMGPDGALLFEAGTKRIVGVYDDAQAYFDFTAALRKVRPQLKRMRALAARMPAPPPPTIDTHFLPIKEKRTVAGLPCEMYDRFENGRVTLEACYVAPEIAPGLVENHRLMAKLSEVMAAAFLMKLPPEKRQKATGDQVQPGLAIWGQTIGPDRKRGEVFQLKSFKTEELPGSIFSVPADYHEVDQPLDPPRDGAERQRALKLARSSPRGDSDLATGFRISALVVLLLVGVLAFGLLVQAFCLHLVAALVIPEARFINAIVATATLWALVLPLELLKVWPPVEIAVGALAAFAGIKVGYRVSTARSIALIVVSAIITILAHFLLTGGLGRLLVQR
jgi:hypothetical protein